jgi:hypothetical protein
VQLEQQVQPVHLDLGLERQDHKELQVLLDLQVQRVPLEQLVQRERQEQMVLPAQRGLQAPPVQQERQDQMELQKLYTVQFLFQI